MSNARNLTRKPRHTKNGTKPPIANASANNSPNDRLNQIKARRELEVQHAVANNLMAQPGVPRNLSEAITLVGTCQDMCPEFERVTRIIQNDIWEPEYVPINPKIRYKKGAPPRVLDENRMIKQYRRSAAGSSEPQPSDLRPPQILEKTLNYLVDEIISKTPNLAKVQRFLWDRTRAIRTDFVLQHLTEIPHLKIAIRCFERIARIHILTRHVVGGKVSHTGEDYDHHQDLEQGINAIRSLMNYYDLVRASYRAPNEPEFRAYWIIAQIPDKAESLLESQIQKWPKEILDHPKVKVARKIFAAACNIQTSRTASQVLARQDYVQFWRLVQSFETSYLTACLAEIWFDKIRKPALFMIMHAYSQGRKKSVEDWTLKQLIRPLGFDNENQVEEYIEAHGCRIGDSNAGRYLDISDATNLTYPHLERFKSPRIQYFSETFAESKRLGRTYPAVINGLSVKAAIAQGQADISSMQKAMSKTETEDEDEEDDEEDEEEEPLFVPRNNKEKTTDGPETEAPLTLNGTKTNSIDFGKSLFDKTNPAPVSVNPTSTFKFQPPTTTTTPLTSLKTDALSTPLFNFTNGTAPTPANSALQHPPMQTPFTFPGIKAQSPFTSTTSQLSTPATANPFPFPSTSITSEAAKLASVPFTDFPPIAITTTTPTKPIPPSPTLNLASNPIIPNAAPLLNGTHTVPGPSIHTPGLSPAPPLVFPPAPNSTNQSAPQLFNSFQTISPVPNSLNQPVPVSSIHPATTTITADKFPKHVNWAENLTEPQSSNTPSKPQFSINSSTPASQFTQPLKSSLRDSVPQLKDQSKSSAVTGLPNLIQSQSQLGSNQPAVSTNASSPNITTTTPTISNQVRRKEACMDYLAYQIVADKARGLLQQYIEYIFDPIYNDAKEEFQAGIARAQKLGIKYFALWKQITLMRRNKRRAFERRARFLAESAAKSRLHLKSQPRKVGDYKGKMADYEDVISKVQTVLQSSGSKQADSEADDDNNDGTALPRSQFRTSANSIFSEPRYSTGNKGKQPMRNEKSTSERQQKLRSQSPIRRRLPAPDRADQLIRAHFLTGQPLRSGLEKGKLSTMQSDYFRMKALGLGDATEEHMRREKRKRLSFELDRSRRGTPEIDQTPRKRIQHNRTMSMGARRREQREEDKDEELFKRARNAVKALDDGINFCRDSRAKSRYGLKVSPSMTPASSQAAATPPSIAESEFSRLNGRDSPSISFDDEPEFEPATQYMSSNHRKIAKNDGSHKSQRQVETQAQKSAAVHQNGAAAIPLPPSPLPTSSAHPQHYSQAQTHASAQTARPPIEYIVIDDD